MNDLDRKIAELKGWEWDESARMVWTEPPFESVVFGEKTESRRGLVMSFCNWSTFDSKALELVDEMPKPLFFIQRYGVLGEKHWKAHFVFGRRLTYFDKERSATVSIPDVPKDIAGEGRTRSEAICRAYIAAREWLAEREPGGPGGLGSE